MRAVACAVVVSQLALGSLELRQLTFLQLESQISKSNPYKLLQNIRLKHALVHRFRMFEKCLTKMKIGSMVKVDRGTRRPVI